MDNIGEEAPEEGMAKGMRLALGVLLAVLLGGTGWMFRYAYLPPVVYQDTSTRDNPHGRSVVVCKVNRWTAYASCERVIVDLEEIVKDMERWAKDRETK